MKRRTLLTGAAALAAAPLSVKPVWAQAQTPEKTKVIFWHAMTGALGQEVGNLCNAFNASQNEVEVQPIFKGSYPETLTAAIAAFRAGQAPHIVQIFEVGTGSMLAAGPAVKQAWQLVEGDRRQHRPRDLHPRRARLLPLPDGRMASMPFNSSTAVMWYNKDAFEKAGLDPEKPPATWDELVDGELRDHRRRRTPTPVADDDGLAHLDPVRAIQRAPQPALSPARRTATRGSTPMLDSTAKPLRQAAPAPPRHGEGRHLQICRPRQRRPTRSSTRGQARDRLRLARPAAATSCRAPSSDGPRRSCPTTRRSTRSPNNSIIGGASLWTMTAPNRTPAEYKAVAQFLPSSPARAGRRMAPGHRLRAR